MTVIEVKPHRWAVFRELGSVVTVEPKWNLEGVFPSRAVFKVAARQETRCEWPLRRVISVCHCRVESKRAQSGAPSVECGGSV
jgi:hypothetical protein